MGVWNSLLVSRAWIFAIICCLLSQAHCQSGCGKIGVTRTISNDADATEMATCTVFSGSIAIATSMPGEVEVLGVTEVLEDFVVANNSFITSLGSESLKRINGNFKMFNTTILSTVSFPALIQVGTLDWSALPAVSFFNFTAGLSTVTNFTIANTFLSSFEGINLKNADNIHINNNLRLQELSLPLEASSVSINIVQNGLKLAVDFPSLKTAGTINLSRISSISMQALTYLSGRLLLLNSGLTKFNVDTLTVVGTNLTIQNNANLVSTSFQGLLSADSIDITNNSALVAVGLGKFGDASDINIEGDFTNITMPGLRSVNSTFIINSTDTTFNCSIFDAAKEQDKITGDYTCLGTHQKLSTTTSAPPGSTSSSDTGNSNPDPTTTDNASPKSGLTGGARAGIAIGCIAVALIVGVAAFLIIRRRRIKKKSENASGTMGTDGKPEIDGKPVVDTKVEMDGTQAPLRELPHGREAHELAGEHGVSEVAGPGETFELPGESASSRGGN